MAAVEPGEPVLKKSKKNVPAATEVKEHESKTVDDPLQLSVLFEGAGYGDVWDPLLRDLLKHQFESPKFIGPFRDSSIVPLRELTFQALKPHPPQDWDVLIFGQNPYPRVDSATGVAMFDNTFHEWKEKRFGQVTSMRNIIKQACMWKYNVAKATPVADLRQILRKNKIVQPPEWFQAMLTQGVLLLNASLTASSDKPPSITTTQHANFWKPVIHRVVKEILAAKEKLPDGDRHKGVVFAWWGSHAKALKKVCEQMCKMSKVPVRHVDHCNPAAMADAFCNSDHFGAVNAKLKELGMDTIDWLPEVGWDQAEQAQTTKQPAAVSSSGAGAGASAGASAGAAGAAGAEGISKYFLKPQSTKAAAAEDEDVVMEDKQQQQQEQQVAAAASADRPERDRGAVSARMASFISHTMDLHQFYLDRLQGAAMEDLQKLEPITGIFQSSNPLVELKGACKPFMKLLSGVDDVLKKTLRFAEGFADSSDTPCALSVESIRALHMYTCESALYRKLNASLRDPTRLHVPHFLPYLRCFLHALRQLPSCPKKLYRGVKLNLRLQYQKASTVTWWGISSCTPNERVATGFKGGKGSKGTLFEIEALKAYNIQRFSAFSKEEEYIIPPGAQFTVTAVKSGTSFTTICLKELDVEPLVG